MRIIELAIEVAIITVIISIELVRVVVVSGLSQAGGVVVSSIVSLSIAGEVLLHRGGRRRRCMIKRITHAIVHLVLSWLTWLAIERTN